MKKVILFIVLSFCIAKTYSQIQINAEYDSNNQEFVLSLKNDSQETIYINDNAGPIRSGTKVWFTLLDTHDSDKKTRWEWSWFGLNKQSSTIKLPPQEVRYYTYDFKKIFSPMKPFNRIKFEYMIFSYTITAEGEYKSDIIDGEKIIYK